MTSCGFLDSDKNTGQVYKVASSLDKAISRYRNFMFCPVYCEWEIFFDKFWDISETVKFSEILYSSLLLSGLHLELFERLKSVDLCGRT